MNIRMQALARRSTGGDPPTVPEISAAPAVDSAPVDRAPRHQSGSDNPKAPSAPASSSLRRLIPEPVRGPGHAREWKEGADNGGNPSEE